MTVLGIDTGDKESAYVLFNGNVLKCGKLPNAQVEDLIFNGWDVVVAVEAPTLFGKRVYPQIMETAIQAGRFLGLGAARVKTVRRFSRQETSLHCAGARSCDDKQMKHCLIERFGDVGTKKNPGPLYGLSGADMFDALAVAVTAYDKEGVVDGAGSG